MRENKPLALSSRDSKAERKFRTRNNFKDFQTLLLEQEESPLAVGYSKDENYIGSDSYALKSMTNKISYLDDGELCVLTKDEVSFYDASLNKVNKNFNVRK